MKPSSPPLPAGLEPFERCHVSLAPRQTCPFCRDQVREPQGLAVCQACLTVQHAACAEEGGGCSTPGCAHAPWASADAAAATPPPPPRRRRWLAAAAGVLLAGGAAVAAWAAWEPEPVCVLTVPACHGHCYQEPYPYPEPEPEPFPYQEPHGCSVPEPFPAQPILFDGLRPGRTMPPRITFHVSRDALRPHEALIEGQVEADAWPVEVRVSGPQGSLGWTAERSGELATVVELPLEGAAVRVEVTDALGRVAVVDRWVR